MAPPDAFVALYEREAEKVLLYLTRRTFDAEIALDLTAETFAQAWRSWPTVRLDSAEEVLGWLFTIARRQLGRYLRRGRVERRAMNEFGFSVPTMAEDEIAGHQRQRLDVDRSRRRGHRLVTGDHDQAAERRRGAGHSGRPQPTGDLENFSCSGPDLCVAAGTRGQVLMSTDPAGPAAWTPETATSGQVTAIYCAPGGTLCLAGDSDGDIATTSDAASGSPWTSVATGDGRIGELVCTQAHCLAAGTLPLRAPIPSAGGSWTWAKLAIETHAALSSVSCPSPHLCLGADDHDYFESADPARGVGSWTSRSHGSAGFSPTIDTACASSTLCFAVVEALSIDQERSPGGNLVRFNPVGGAHGFSATGVDGDFADVVDVTCAQGTCVAGYPGKWFQTSDPAENRSWRRIGAPRFDVTCLHADTSCVALADGPFIGTAGPDLLVANRRGGPWRAQAVDPGEEITGLACTGTGACVIVDEAGRLLVSSDPVAGPATWQLSTTDPYGFNGVARATATRCVAVDGRGGVVVGRP